jgi:hypothetical protein
MTKFSSLWKSNFSKLLMGLVGYEIKNMNQQMHKILTKQRGAPGAISGD